MASQTGRARVDWRRAFVGGVLAVGLMSGFGAATAFAQPADPDPTTVTGPCTGEDCSKRVAAPLAPGEACTGEDCSRRANAADCPEGADCSGGERQATMTADQALTIIYNEYSLGDGGGQLSTLIDDVMKLRAQGFKPSNANKVAIEDALDHRPNQTPLIEALKTTLQYQRKLQAQQQMAAQQQQQSGGAVPVIPGG